MPYHPLVQKYLKGHVPSIITFGVSGGYEAGLEFFDSVKLFKRLLNLGDAKSLVIHPASTTHRQLSESELRSGRNTARDSPTLDRPRTRRRSHRRH